MSVSTRATFEYTHTGQHRAFGDTFTEGILTVEMSSPYVDNGAWRQVAVGETMAKALAQGFAPWYVGSTDPFKPRLDTFEPLGEGRYKVVTRSRYND